MAAKVESLNEVSLAGVYYPITRPVQSTLASIYPSKVVIGDTTKDSQTRASVVAWSDWRGGIGVDRMEEGRDINRAWWSTLQLRYKNHLVLGNYANQTDTIGHGLATNGSGAGVATIIEFNDMIYAVWNGNSGENPKMYVYNNTLNYWWDGRTEDQAIGVHGDDSFGVPDQVTDSVVFTKGTTDYLVLAHHDENGSGYSYSTQPSYYSSSNAAWTNDATDTKYLATWDDRLWGISNTGQLWYAITPGTEIVDAKLPLRDNYVTSLFVARSATGEPILYTATREGLWAHDAANARFVKTEVEFPFHPHGGKGSKRWRDSIYFPSGLGMYRYVNGANQAVVTVVGPDRDDGLPEDNRGTIMMTEGTHNELLVGVDATTAPEATGTNDVPYQWNTSHGGSPVIEPSVGYSSILAYNEQGWQAKWVSGTQGRKIDTMHVSNAYSTLNENYRLWWGFNDYVYYMKLPVDIINPSRISSFEYAPSGIHETPWFNAGQSEVDKLALKLKIEVEDASSTETVVVKYATNYTETYTTLSPTITSSGIATFTFDDASDNPIGKSFRSIKFRLELARTTTTTTLNYLRKTPDVVSMTLEWRKKLEAKWGHQVQVDINKDYKGKSPKDLRSALLSAIESETLVEFTFRDDSGGTRNYYVDVVSATGLEYTGPDERGVSTISLVEP